MHLSPESLIDLINMTPNDSHSVAGNGREFHKWLCVMDSERSTGYICRPICGVKSPIGVKGECVKGVAGEEGGGYHLHPCGSVACQNRSNHLSKIA